MLGKQASVALCLVTPALRMDPRGLGGGKIEPGLMSEIIIPPSQEEFYPPRPNEGEETSVRRCAGGSAERRLSLLCAEGLMVSRVGRPPTAPTQPSV